MRNKVPRSNPPQVILPEGYEDRINSTKESPEEDIKHYVSLYARVLLLLGAYRRVTGACHLDSPQKRTELREGVDAVTRLQRGIRVMLGELQQLACSYLAEDMLLESTARVVLAEYGFAYSGRDLTTNPQVILKVLGSQVGIPRKMGSSEGTFAKGG